MAQDPYGITLELSFLWIGLLVSLSGLILRVTRPCDDSSGSRWHDRTALSMGLGALKRQLGTGQ